MNSNNCSQDGVPASHGLASHSTAHRRTLRLRRFLAGWLALAALGLGGASLSAKEKELDISLKAQHVVRDAAGKESLTDEVELEPNQVLQYTAVFHNQSAQPLRNLAPTLPIPQGLEYIIGSAMPAPTSASLDGKKFEPYPIRRVHKLADGREILTEVPASAYRALRWSVNELPAGNSAIAIARARVASTVAQR